MKTPKKKNRREFAKAVAMLGGLPLACSGQLKADDKAASADSLVKMIEAQMEVFRLRHGSHVAEEDLPEVAKTLTRIHYSSERLKQLKLQNGDEPAVVFHPE